jgi:hypothetical protein
MTVLSKTSVRPEVALNALVLRKWTLKTNLEVGTELLEVGDKCIVRTQMNLLPKLLPHVLADLLRVDKQDRGVCGDCRVAKEDGIEVDVGPAKVKRRRGLPPPGQRAFFFSTS